MAEPVKHGATNGGFERQDMSPRAVYLFLLSLAVGTVVVAVVLMGGYHLMDAYEKSHQPMPGPLVQTPADTRDISKAEVNAFPQPRLEKNERLEINEFRLHEEQQLASYGWVDEKAGVMRIPIERAMQLVAQRGLPTTPRAGIVPASDVVSDAAKPADTGNPPAAKGKKK